MRGVGPVSSVDFHLESHANTSTGRSVLSAREAVPVPEGAEYRLPYLRRLLEHRQDLHFRGLQSDVDDVQ